MPLLLMLKTHTEHTYWVIAFWLDWGLLLSYLRKVSQVKRASGAVQIKTKRRTQILCHCLVGSIPANKRKDQKYFHVRWGRSTSRTGPIKDTKNIIIEILKIKKKVVNLNFLKTILTVDCSSLIWPIIKRMCLIVIRHSIHILRVEIFVHWTNISHSVIWWANNWKK